LDRRPVEPHHVVMRVNLRAQAVPQQGPAAEYDGAAPQPCGPGVMYT
jgi:hypothetical protein